MRNNEPPLLARVGLYSIESGGVNGATMYLVADDDKVKESLADYRAYAENWKRVAPLLEEVRKQDIRNSKTYGVLYVFDTFVQKAKRDVGMRPSSGLVEFYKILAKRK